MITIKNKNLFIGFTNDFVSTSLQGSIYITYKDLVSKIGKQNVSSNDICRKSDAEWNVFTPYGNATIYNYKDGKNYNGKDGLEIKDITDWHIGGTNKETAECIIRELTK